MKPHQPNRRRGAPLPAQNSHRHVDFPGRNCWKFKCLVLRVGIALALVAAERNLNAGMEGEKVMESTVGMFAAVSSAFQQGGIWMWLILIAQAVSIAIIIERVISLYVMRSPQQRSLAKQLEKDIKKGQIKKMVSKARSFGRGNPIGAVASAGGQAAMDFGGREEIQSRMDEILLNENSKLERRTGFLAMLGNVGTLLGLLGTIIGLIKAFSSVADVDPVQKATILTQGISMAMSTTAYGLIMAIPALVMYSVLQNRASQLQEDLNQGALRVFNWLSFNYETVPQRPVKSKVTS